ncbi:MAG: ankyrin repeat domain-containing protein [Rickettsiales bacterium]|nr:ankyrin repeat domain-containing protein [Pseudomonadota bacterium]MDA0965405.1 ankyrin repeat domain-containing protein [Pseudomonadota bacterium]MDG4542730.1 ankyrin repeat domain-containing protein [Rickettsiales bacterium]MDG4544822.1 ankyrin repeat domain-containing protein [Rickettsiales bacterium]MDG4546944.1 ankyrin repeat domain-containing protein [Rickettsiales bacterium]
MRVLSLFIILFLTFSWNAVADSSSFNNSLVDAADNGDIQEVRRLLNSGAKPDSEGDFGVTALMRAAFKGHLDVAELLIKSGAYVNAADIGGDTALHMASRSGNAKMVKMLLHYDAGIDAVDNQKWTPLMRSIMAKSPETTEILISEGADLNAKNNMGNSSIVQAAISGNESVLKVILSSDKFSDISEEQKDASVAIAKKRGYGKASQMISSTMDYFQRESTVKTAYNTDAQKDVYDTSEVRQTQSTSENDTKATDENISPVQNLKTLVDKDDGAWGFGDKESPFSTVASPYSETEGERETIISQPQQAENQPIFTSPYSNTVNTPKTKPTENSGASKQIIPVGYFADRYTIQIGAFSEKGQADYIWKNLKNKHIDILSNLEPTILSVNDNSGQSFFRLRVGSFQEKEAASKKCSEMQQRKIDCFVVRSSREQAPMTKATKPDSRQVQKQNNSVDSDTGIQTNYFRIVPIKQDYMQTNTSLSGGEGKSSVKDGNNEPESVSTDAPIDTMPNMNKENVEPYELNDNQSPHSYLYKNHASNVTVEQKPVAKADDVKKVKKYEQTNELFVAPYEENNMESVMQSNDSDIQGGASDASGGEYEEKQYAGHYESNYQKQLWKNERNPGETKVGQTQQNYQPPAVEQNYQEPIDMYADNVDERLPWLEDRAVADRGVVEKNVEPIKNNNMVRKEDFSYSVNSNAEKQHDYSSFYNDLQKSHNNKEEVSEAVLVRESDDLPWLNDKKTNNYIAPKDISKKGIWLEIYPFPNRATAYDYADRMFKYDEGLKNLQVKLLGGDSPYDRKVRLNVGAIESYAKANMLCHNIISSGLQCYSSGSPMEKSDNIYIIDDNYSGDAYGMNEHSEDIAYARKAVEPKVKKLYTDRSADIQKPYWVNLGAFSNSYKAEYYLMFLKEDHDDILKSTKYSIDGIKQYKRNKSGAVKLKLGPYFDEFNADNICSMLRSRNVSCLVIQ